jgi:hypothetical protein
MTKVNINSQNTKQAWIDYLQALPWTFFITGTTRYPLSLKSNRRLQERFFEALCLRDSKLFYVAEPFDLRDGYHSHSLFYIPANIKPWNPESSFLFREIVNTWQWATGNKDLTKENWSRIRITKYDRKRGAGGYCGKYIFKENADYDLLT